MSINIGSKENPADEGEAQKFLSEGRDKAIRSEILSIIEDEFYALEDYSASHIADCAKRRAEDFLGAVLSGDQDAAAILFETGSGGRYRELGFDAGEPWAEIIHGDVFQTSQMELRDKLVNEYAELLRDERVADLESIVDGLKRQIASLEKQLYESRERFGLD